MHVYRHHSEAVTSLCVTEEKLYSCSYDKSVCQLDLVVRGPSPLKLPWSQALCCEFRIILFVISIYDCW